VLPEKEPPFATNVNRENEIFRGEQIPPEICHFWKTKTFSANKNMVRIVGAHKFSVPRSGFFGHNL